MRFSAVLLSLANSFHVLHFLCGLNRPFSSLANKVFPRFVCFNSFHRVPLGIAARGLRCGWSLSKIERAALFSAELNTSSWTVNRSVGGHSPVTSWKLLTDFFGSLSPPLIAVVLPDSAYPFANLNWHRNVGPVAFIYRSASGLIVSGTFEEVNSLTVSYPLFFMYIESLYLYCRSLVLVHNINTFFDHVMSS